MVRKDYTLDDCAAFDYPAAINKVIEITKQVHKPEVMVKVVACNTVSLELLYLFTVHVDIFIIRRYAANELLKKRKCEGELRKMPKTWQYKFVLFSSVLTNYVISGCKSVGMCT